MKRGFLLGLTSLILLGGQALAQEAKDPFAQEKAILKNYYGNVSFEYKDGEKDLGADPKPLDYYGLGTLVLLPYDFAYVALRDFENGKVKFHIEFMGPKEGHRIFPVPDAYK